MDWFGTSSQDVAPGAGESALEQMYLKAYDDYADALFRHAVLRVRDRELAKDMVQETFVKTWDYLAKGKSIDHVRAFLYRALQNTIVDAMRKKRSVSLDAMHEDDGFEIADETQDPTPEVREEAKVALRHLATLDELYRVPITLRYVDSLTPSEIAKLLGISENVVSVRIHRGLKQLRELSK